jgi:hypothetical protein
MYSRRRTGPKDKVTPRRPPLSTKTRDEIEGAIGMDSIASGDAGAGTGVGATTEAIP